MKWGRGIIGEGTRRFTPRLIGWVESLKGGIFCLENQSHLRYLAPQHFFLPRGGSELNAHARFRGFGPSKLLFSTLESGRFSNFCSSCRQAIYNDKIWGVTFLNPKYPPSRYFPEYFSHLAISLFPIVVPILAVRFVVGDSRFGCLGVFEVAKKPIFTHKQDAKL